MQKCAIYIHTIWLLGASHITKYNQVLSWKQCGWVYAYANYLCMYVYMYVAPKASCCEASEENNK